MIKVTLKPGREKLPKNHHPWIFSGAIEGISDTPSAGEVVAVYSAQKEFIAYGHYNSTSEIRVRLLEWDVNQVITDTWYREKIRNAMGLRKNIISEDTTVYRIIFSESDFLPGLIAERFGNFVVLQSLSSGFDKVKQMIAEIMLEEFDFADGIYEKSDGDGRRMEKLDIETGILAGAQPEGAIKVLENGNVFSVSIKGQKTGFYADQRDNRFKLAKYAAGRNVLDACSYTGGFSSYLMKNGANSSELCDISKDALDAALENMTLNSIDISKILLQKKDVFQHLRDLKKDGKSYDLIVLDPPKLVSSKQSLSRGLRGYKDLNMQAMQLLNNGGILATFSCSGNVSMQQFRESIAFAAKDAKKEIQIIEHLHQSADHPIRASVPETEYLKGVICKVSV